MGVVKEPDLNPPPEAQDNTFSGKQGYHIVLSQNCDKTQVLLYFLPPFFKAIWQTI